MLKIHVSLNIPGAPPPHPGKCYRSSNLKIPCGRREINTGIFGRRKRRRRRRRRRGRKRRRRRRRRRRMRGEGK